MKTDRNIQIFCVLLALILKSVALYSSDKPEPGRKRVAFAQEVLDALKEKETRQAKLNADLEAQYAGLDAQYEETMNLLENENFESIRSLLSKKDVDEVDEMMQILEEKQRAEIGLPPKRPWFLAEAVSSQPSQPKGPVAKKSSWTVTQQSNEPSFPQMASVEMEPMWVFLPDRLMREAMNFNHVCQMRRFSPILSIVAPADMPRLLNFDPNQRGNVDPDLFQIWQSDQGAYGYLLRCLVTIPKGELRAQFFTNIVSLQR